MMSAVRKPSSVALPTSLRLRARPESTTAPSTPMNAQSVTVIGAMICAASVTGTAWLATSWVICGSVPQKLLNSCE